MCTVGIVGLGRIGKTLAKRMDGFDVQLIAADAKYELGSVVDGVEIVSFEQLLASSDAISIHCPLDESTQNLFDLAAFEKMKTNAVLVNTARRKSNVICAAMWVGVLVSAAFSKLHAIGYGITSFRVLAD